MNEKDKLIYVINKRKYLLIDVLIASRESQLKIEKGLDKLGGIEQGVKEVFAGGLFRKPYIITKWLIPTNKLKQYKKVCLR